MGRPNFLGHRGIMVAAWYTCLNPQAVLASPTGALRSSAGSQLAPRDSTYCCSTLANISVPVYYPASAEYTDSIDSYWSLQARLDPWCVATPRDAAEVSAVVTALVSGTEQCEFAVRSGGHMPWAGASDITNGVTIDMSLMNSTTVNANDTATVLPGARWGSVYATLDAVNLATSGGRSSTVGSGGLVIGGGNSFYAARKGLVCDNVAQYEIVLATGDIVYASNETNSDLFQALKGGHANFGIVTRYDLMTFPTDGLWGGTVVYPDSTTPQQLAAFENFADNIANDPYASTICIWQYSSTTDVTVVLNAYDYTKPVEYPAAYDEFFAIEPQESNTMRITNISDLVSELGVPAGQNEVFMTNTFVNDAAVLKKALDLHNDTLAMIKAANPQGSWGYVSMLQPIPPIFTEHSIANGGNVLGLDRFLNETLVMFLAFPSWSDSADDDIFNNAIATHISEINAFAASVGKSNPWIYTNYADITQNPLAGYGADNVAKIKAMASKYDPDAVFQNLMPGGFKISKISA